MGSTIIIVSHVLSELEQVASELAFIFEGKVLVSTSLEDLKSRSNHTSLDKVVMDIFLEKNRGKI